jgi:uncharacterized protein (TIGR02466 family)
MRVIRRTNRYQRAYVSARLLRLSYYSVGQRTILPCAIGSLCEQFGTLKKMKKPATLLTMDSLFASPLFTFELEGYETLNAALVLECSRIRDQSAGVMRSNNNGWHSDPDLFQRSEPNLSVLRESIVSCLADVIRRTTNDRFDTVNLVCDGWININPRGGFNAPHNHAGYLWSGTYYVKVPIASESSGGYIEFLDPRTNANANASSTFQPRYRVAPRPGMLLVFPAYLFHWVYPNEQDEERITIAFNCRLSAARKKINAEQSKLDG